MDFGGLLGHLGALGGGGIDEPKFDTAETIYVSSLALLKMLKHGRSGVPFEVMGLMLGEFVDDYIIRVDDVFAMPQTGTSTSVEAVDNVYQKDMIEMLKQLGSQRNVVGWYHSHPGFGPWLSGVDINTQESFEQLNKRAVALVIDPIQSVKGKVVIDAFRLIPSRFPVPSGEIRQITSHLGELQPPSVVAIVHGLNKYYYSLPIKFRKNEFELKMLMNLGKKDWVDSLELKDYKALSKKNNEKINELVDLCRKFNEELTSAMEKEEKELKKEIEKEKEKKKKDDKKEKGEKTKEEDEKREKVIKNIGKLDPKRHLMKGVNELMTINMTQSLGSYVLSGLF